MYVIGKVKVDSAGRINIRDLFNKLPSEVVIIIDYRNGKLIFKDATLPNVSPRKIRKVDFKGRVQLPKWIPEEFGKEFFLTEDSLAEHSLLAKSFAK